MEHFKILFNIINVLFEKETLHVGPGNGVVLSNRNPVFSLFSKEVGMVLVGLNPWNWKW
jgi:hypothetical protein